MTNSLEIEMMKQKPNFPPLTSMSLVGNIGSAGSGKTYQMLNLQQYYEQTSDENYDISKPNIILYTPFTHVFYISGTQCKTAPKHFIQKDSSELKNVCDYIQQMGEDWNSINQVQQLLLKLTGEESFQILKKLLQILENYKQIYPTLLIKIVDKKTNDYLKTLYKILDVQKLVYQLMIQVVSLIYHLQKVIFYINFYQKEDIGMFLMQYLMSTPLQIYLET